VVSSAVRLTPRVNSTVSLLASIVKLMKVSDISVDPSIVIGNLSRSSSSSNILPERVVVRPASIVGSLHENFVHLRSSITMSSISGGISISSAPGIIVKNPGRISERDCPSIPASTIRPLIISAFIMIISSGITASPDSENVTLPLISNLSCPELGDDISIPALPLVIGRSPHPSISN